MTYDPPANVFPGDKFIAASPHFRVELIQDGVARDSFVYSMQAQHRTNNSKDTAWTTFSFSGRVTVRVTRMDAAIEWCEILPRSRAIEVRRDGPCVEFVLDRPGQFSVEFEQGLKVAHPLFVFANPLEENPPNPGDPDVLYFGPGVHEIGEKHPIRSGQTVYLAGGAYVKGNFLAENARNITIRGRGILSGEQFPVRTGGYMVTMREVDDVFVEGITFIHPPSHNMRINGRRHVVRNVKFTGWHFSTDGVQAGSESVIEDCFFKVNDDAIMLYFPDSEARRCVVWQMENGSPLQIGWGGDGDRSGFHAHDIDIIRMESEWDNENLAVFCAIHGSGAIKSDYLFEDIRIENADWRAFRIATMPNRWAPWDTERGALHDITFRNIEYRGPQRIPSLIMGHDAKHPVYNVTFENVVINGRRLTGPDPDVLVVDPETTRNIQFR